MFTGQRSPLRYAGIWGGEISNYKDKQNKKNRRKKTLKDEACIEQYPQKAMLWMWLEGDKQGKNDE